MTSFVNTTQSFEHSGVVRVQRAAMLADPAWNAQETVITRAMLASAEQIVVCNALRGAVVAQLA